MNESRYSSLRIRLSSPCGTRVQPVYKRVRDEKGFYRLEKVGENDLQALIDSFASDVDIKTLVKRYENGDLSVFSRAQGSFVDLTSFPSDLTSAFDIVEKARSFYNSLDSNTLREVGSFSDFLSSVNTFVFNESRRVNDSSDPKKEVSSDES